MLHKLDKCVRRNQVGVLTIWLFIRHPGWARTVPANMSKLLLLPPLFWHLSGWGTTATCEGWVIHWFPDFRGWKSFAQGLLSSMHYALTKSNMAQDHYRQSMLRSLVFSVLPLKNQLCLETTYNWWKKGAVILSPHGTWQDKVQWSAWDSTTIFWHSYLVVHLRVHNVLGEVRSQSTKYMTSI